MKRLFTCLIFIGVILFSLNIGFSYKGYNSSLDDMYLTNNGWCVGITTSFKVYNKTEYILKKSEFSNICVGNQTVKHDHCITIQDLTPNVKVYSGPFDSMSTIFDGKASADGVFNVTFQNPGPHLIELTGLAKYNDYFDSKFNVINCPGVKIENKNISNLSKISLFNQSYVIGKIKINLTNTIINSSSNISIDENLNVSKFNLPTLNNSLNIFNVNLTSNNFSNFKISIPIVFENKSNIFLNYYNTSKKKWVNVSDFSILNSNLIFISSNLGYYGIVEFKPLSKNISIKKNQSIVSSTQNLSNSTSPLLNSTSGITLEADSQINSSNKSSKIKYYVLGGVLFLVIIFIVFFIYNKSKLVSKKEDLPDTSKKVEVLNSYEQIYSHTKDYVRIYSPKYTQDQIYRALKNAKIPKDIIDKVLNEEY